MNAMFKFALSYFYHTSISLIDANSSLNSPPVLTNRMPHFDLVHSTLLLADLSIS